jgi:hypothetical protein
MEDVMGLSIADAYAQIKRLENSGQITLPEPQATVTMGTIHLDMGTFTWALPTLIQTTVTPPGPGQKTNTITKVTVGVVSTKAVDLRLRFEVTKPVSPTPATPVPVTATAASEVRLAPDAILGTGFLLNNGASITPWPTVSSTETEITVDAGLVSSAAIPNQHNITPPVTTFAATINIQSHPAIELKFFVLRPPVIGMGAFTIPALPMTIVYAPPQGKLDKNTATYSNAQTVSRTVTTSISSANSTKQAQAYTAGDLIGKLAGAITAVAAVVGTDGAAAGGGASVAGALSELGTALFGPAKDANDSTASATKQISGELNLLSTVLNGLDDTISSQTSTVTTENDHSITLTTTNLDQWAAESGLGPGVGDRIVYLSNVKVVWMAVNGEVGIHVLGFDGFGANSAQDLLQEEQSLASGKPPRLGLDLDTIKSLLSQDPLVETARSTLGAGVGPPAVGPPRFVPANPAGHKGSGTGASSGGDVVQASFDTATDDKQTTTNSQTNITDAKPGWLSVLFGADNVETTTTSVLTSTQSVDDKSDDKVTATVTFFSEGADDPYNVLLFYDNTFGTYAILDVNSSLLVGNGGATFIGTVNTRAPAR